MRQLLTSRPDDEETGQEQKCGDNAGRDGGPAAHPVEQGDEQIRATYNDCAEDLEFPVQFLSHDKADDRQRSQASNE